MPAESGYARVFLTGFMGSGKSTLGPPLARALKLRFQDLDTIIEQSAACSIEEIFAGSGEAHFRMLETTALRATPPGTVCALGGGALAREQNLQWALSHGIVLYLKVPVPVLQQRLASDARARPLLRDASGQVLAPAAMCAKIAALLGERTPFYERAHITLPASGGANIVADAAVRAVRSYNARSRNERR